MCHVLCFDFGFTFILQLCEVFCDSVRSSGFPGGSDGKNLPAMQEIRVWSLGQEDPLEKGMATHASIPP